MSQRSPQLPRRVYDSAGESSYSFETIRSLLRQESNSFRDSLVIRLFLERESGGKREGVNLSMCCSTRIPRGKEGAPFVWRVSAEWSISCYGEIGNDWRISRRGIRTRRGSLKAKGLGSFLYSMSKDSFLRQRGTITLDEERIRIILRPIDPKYSFFDQKKATEKTGLSLSLFREGGCLLSTLRSPEWNTGLARRDPFLVPQGFLIRRIVLVSGPTPPTRGREVISCRKE